MWKPVSTLLLFLHWTGFVLISEQTEISEYNPDECLSITRTYTGTVSLTQAGEKCLPWVDSPNSNSEWTKAYAKEQANYCRNPDNDPKGLWCRSAKGNFGYCNIKRCAEDVACYEGNGREYSFHQDQTKSGSRCEPWIATNHRRSMKDTFRFYYESNGSLSSLHNNDRKLRQFRSCRNPSGMFNQPSCYVNDPDESVLVVEECDIPSCSSPSPLMYPLKAGACAYGFVRESSFAEASGRRTTLYNCAMQHRLLHRNTRPRIYDFFVDFCLYLSSETSFCPAGFKKTRRYSPNRSGITSFGRNSIWRLTDSLLLETILCCSDSDYFKNNTGLYKRTFIKIETRKSSTINMVLKNQLYSLPIYRQSPQLLMHSNDYTDNMHRPLVTDFDNVGAPRSSPRFASVRRCPLVSGTMRTLTIVSVKPDDNQAVSDVVCEYHQTKYATQRDLENIYSKANISIAVLVKGQVCPVEFKKHRIPSLLLFAFGTDSVLCSTPMRPNHQLPIFKRSEYCLLVIIEMNVNKSFSTFSTDHQFNDFPCPEGFHPYEIRFSQKSLKLPMCCSNREHPGSVDEDTQTKLPFDFTSSPALIINGQTCPPFYSDHKKLSTIKFTTGLTIPTGGEVQILGKADPITVDGGLTFSVCQYMDAQTTLGVKSATYGCQGLGQNVGTGFFGATCGFRVNQSVEFPPGIYCFYLLSDKCPEGFTKSHSALLNAVEGSVAKRLCCRFEESLGAIRMPIDLKAPFKLPRDLQPCQAFLNFNMDGERLHCMYYPRGKDPQALFVWPRLIVIKEGKVVSRPFRCLLRASKRIYPHAMYRRLNGLRFSDYTHFRERWNNSMNKQFQGCMDEVYWSLLPPRSASDDSYCIFVHGECHSSSFEMVGVSPFMNGVLCCSKPRSLKRTFRNNKPDSHIRSMVTLGKASIEDLTKLDDVVREIVLPLHPSVNDSKEYCPKFKDLRLTRRLGQVLTISPKLNGKGSVHLTELFNASKLNSAQFTAKTGITRKGERIYIIYCEYKSTLYDVLNFDGKSWPVGNYAIPKSLYSCPNGSDVVTIHHKQDSQGFHYSQPIHLDGRYMQRYKDVWLSYCVFGQQNSPEQTQVNYDNGLPPGHYCVLRVKGECPHAFTEGTLSILEGSGVEAEKQETDTSSEDTTSFRVDTKPQPDISRVRTRFDNNHKSVYRKEYKFCCRTDSPSADSPITGFPTVTGPFYLYRIGDKCQEIEGLRVTDEFICMDAPSQHEGSVYSLERNQNWTSYSTEGMTPVRIPYKDHCDAEIDLCYYEQDTQVSENETYVHNTLKWPIGDYALPNVHRSDLSVACPPGFEQSIISMSRFQTFFDIEVIPITMGPYFLEWFTHNYTSLSVHYCARLNNESEEESMIEESFESSTLTSSAANMTIEELAEQWPKGDYCVISNSHDAQCPPGLHRYSKVMFELCCRKDEVESNVIVNWAFTGDFFLLGGAKCLNVNNTKTERYIVRLISDVVDKHEEKWEILCHYIPQEWLDQPTRWSNEEYMLPIGRRSGIKLSSLATFISINLDTVEANSLNETNLKLFPHGPGKYSCPDTFNRTRFTFVSRESKKQKFIDLKNDTDSWYQSSIATAMEFCVKNNNGFNSSAKVTERLWPDGDYCVFTINKECPVNMRAKSEIPYKIPRFFLKRVDILNENGDIVFETVHDQADATNHVLYFMRCCREDRNLLLRLPPSKDGFYLASSSERCSSIPGTILDREKVTTYLTSSTDRTNTMKIGIEDITVYQGMFSMHNGVLDLCYYHPTQGIDYTSIVTGNRFATSVNMSEGDIDEIAKLCGCAKDALCLLSNQAECVCKPGYFGDGRHVCSKVTPFTDSCANLCDSNAICAERMQINIKKGGAINVPEVQYIKHMCICHIGYAGDGYTCRPECSSRHCQPFSRCVYSTMGASTKCVCLEGTIESDQRCHLDVYKTLLQEKDLPQFLVHHDHCLRESTLEALRYADKTSYFYIFVPKQIIKTCEDLRTHVVVLPKAYNRDEIKAATADAPIIMVTENSTEITIYSEGGKLFIDGEPAGNTVVHFVNGEMYFLSNYLKRTPHVPGMHTLVSIVIAILLLICVAGVGSLIYLFAVRKLQPPRWRPKFRGLHRAAFQRTYNRQRDEGILVDDDDN